MPYVIIVGSLLSMVQTDTLHLELTSSQFVTNKLGWVQSTQEHADMQVTDCPMPVDKLTLIRLNIEWDDSLGKAEWGFQLTANPLTIPWASRPASPRQLTWATVQASFSATP